MLFFELVSLLNTLIIYQLSQRITARRWYLQLGLLLKLTISNFCSHQQCSYGVVKSKRILISFVNSTTKHNFQFTVMKKKHVAYLPLNFKRISIDEIIGHPSYTMHASPTIRIYVHLDGMQMNKKKQNSSLGFL